MWGPVWYICEALAFTSFLCLFPLFTDALLWVSLQNVTLLTSLRFLHCSWTVTQEKSPETVKSIFQNVGPKFFTEPEHSSGPDNVHVVSLHYYINHIWNCVLLNLLFLFSSHWSVSCIVDTLVYCWFILIYHTYLITQMIVRVCICFTALSVLLLIYAFIYLYWVGNAYSDVIVLFSIVLCVIL